MKQILLMTAFALTFIFNLSSAQISAQTLLNEVYINPLGDDRPCEYIEIRGTPGATLSNLYFAVVEGDGSAAGQVDFLVNLSGRTLGSNGLLVIVSPTPCPGRTIPAQTTQVTTSALDTEGSGIENGANSFLLISSPTPLVDNFLNLDANEDGMLDSLPTGAVVVDGIGWFQNDMGTVYDATLPFLGRTPDAASRFPGNNMPNSSSAWYYGDLDSTAASPNFPSNGQITPGAPNVGEARRVFSRQFDFDGDNKSDVSVFRNGAWYINRSQQGFTGINWGFATDVLAPADFDGDGRTDVAVFRGGNWYWINSSNNQFSAIQFGVATDIPIPGDFDGDGKADVAVFRPSNGTWYWLNSSNNQFSAAQFGINGDKPLLGDFDGDGKADLAVTRTTNESMFWYWTASSTNQFNAVQFGVSTDIATAADYDGDGKTDVSVFRPTNGTWYRLNSSQNNQFSAVQFGQAGDVPVAADYDGEGKADIAVFRPENSSWYRLNSANGKFIGFQFGVNNDKPVPAVFIR